MLSKRYWTCIFSENVSFLNAPPLLLNSSRGTGFSHAGARRWLGNRDMFLIVPRTRSAPHEVSTRRMAPVVVPKIAGALFTARKAVEHNLVPDLRPLEIR